MVIAVITVIIVVGGVESVLDNDTLYRNVPDDLPHLLPQSPCNVT